MNEVVKIITDIGEQIEKHRDCSEKFHVIGYMDDKFMLLHPRDFPKKDRKKRAIANISQTMLKKGLSSREWDDLYYEISRILKRRDVNDSK